MESISLIDRSSECKRLISTIDMFASVFSPAVIGVRLSKVGNHVTFEGGKVS
jgi:hypothetical protein